MRYYRLVWLIVGIVIMVGGKTSLRKANRRDNSLSPLTPRSLRPISILPKRPGLPRPLCFCMPFMTRCSNHSPGMIWRPAWRSRTESLDGLVYEFKLREGLTFHNGAPFTAEDVKFSFFRYKATRPSCYTRRQARSSMLIACGSSCRRPGQIF